MDQDSNQNIIIAEMKKDIDYIKKSIDDLTKTVNSYMKSSEKKYANKWTEKAIVLVIVAVFGALITYAMTSALK